MKDPKKNCIWVLIVRGFDTWLLENKKRKGDDKELSKAQ